MLLAFGEWSTLSSVFLSERNITSSEWIEEKDIMQKHTTVFIDTRLSETKHPRKRFQNFRQSYMLSTDRIEIHQSQPAGMT